MATLGVGIREGGVEGRWDRDKDALAGVDIEEFVLDRRREGDTLLMFTCDVFGGWIGVGYDDTESACLNWEEGKTPSSVARRHPSKTLLFRRFRRGDACP